MSRVVHLHIELAGLLVIFEWCLQIHNSLKAMSSRRFTSIIIRGTTQACFVFFLLPSATMPSINDCMLHKEMQISRQLGTEENRKNRPPPWHRFHVGIATHKNTNGYFYHAWFWCMHIGLLTCDIEFMCCAEIYLTWSMGGDLGTYGEARVQWTWNFINKTRYKVKLYKLNKT